MANNIKFKTPDGSKVNSVEIFRKQIKFYYPCTSRDECSPYEVIFKPGAYLIECWGAGYSSIISSQLSLPHYGAYTKGTIIFHHHQTLYLYLGASSGKFNVLHPNASLKMGVSSNGATDVRIKNGNYYDFESLKSRIMVAAGAGSTDNYYGLEGHGGTFEGTDAIINCSLQNVTLQNPLIIPGGKQTNDYNDCKDANCIRSYFGLAGYKYKAGDEGDVGAFGGGGYYAGASSAESGKGGGGSSFISGHLGCNAISNSSIDFAHIEHTNQSIHYSRLSFTNTAMIAGNETHYMSSGKVVITVLFPYISCRDLFVPRFSVLFFLLYI